MAAEERAEHPPTGLADAAGRRSRGGRPTRAAAAERDERLIDIATAMFMEHGFEATSMDRLAEAAAIGKATLYTRYSDKGALFADVLQRRILEVYEPLEEEFAAHDDGADLPDLLRRVSARLIEKSLKPNAFKLGRILAAQAQNFPELAQLALREGYGRQARLIEAILTPFAKDTRYLLDDPKVMADHFLALVIGRSSRLAIYGFEPDRAEVEARTIAAVDFFLRGIARR